MGVPYTFGTATTSIPLSQLDANFNTTATLGNTAVGLGNTTTTVGNLTLTNATISSGTVTVTSISDSGNLTFTGTGNRILGDFSNATRASSVQFQTTTVAANRTQVGAIPPTGATQAQFEVINSPTATDCQLGQFLLNATELSIRSSILGTASYLPITFLTSGSERLRIDTSGKVGIGTTTMTNLLNVAGAIQSSSTLVAVEANTVALSQEAGYGRVAAFGPNSSTGGTLYLYSISSNGSVQNGVVIDSSGDVGIGTSSPGSRLSVTGTANIATFDGGTNTSITLTGSGRSDIFLIDSGAATDQKRLTIRGDGGNFIFGVENDAVTTFTERMRIDSSGYVQINTTTADAVLSIHTDGTNTAKGYGVALVNDAGGGNTWTLQCGQYAVNNGAFTIYDKTNNKYAFKIESSTNYVTAKGIYDLTSGSAANVYVDSNGALYRSTSSLKYKTNIQNTSHGLAEVLQLRPVTYKGKNDGDKVFGGLIAEEVDKIGLKEFVEYADDGSPDSLAYGNMVSLLAKAIQEQQAMIVELTNRIKKLEGA